MASTRGSLADTHNRADTHTALLFYCATRLPDLVFGFLSCRESSRSPRRIREVSFGFIHVYGLGLSTTLDTSRLQ